MTLHLGSTSIAITLIAELKIDFLIINFLIFTAQWSNGQYINTFTLKQNMEVVKIKQFRCTEKIGNSSWLFSWAGEANGHVICICFISSIQKMKRHKKLNGSAEYNSYSKNQCNNCVCEAFARSKLCPVLVRNVSVHVWTRRKRFVCFNKLRIFLSNQHTFWFNYCLENETVFNLKILFSFECSKVSVV